MRSREILKMGLELDLAKARPAAVIGGEKIWSGVTYVKTAKGWRPKNKMKESKPEEARQIHTLKTEKPPILKEKQIEAFAIKAKKDQLESAIKDSEQSEKVKKIAQEELEKRKELSKDLDYKKKEPAIKTIKKTGIVVDGHKVFITMNKDGTGYESKGFNISLKSKEGESLGDFKERLKSELKESFSSSKQNEEIKKIDLKEGASKTKENNFDKENRNKDALQRIFSDHVKSPEIKENLEHTYKKIRDKYKPGAEITKILEWDRNALISEANASKDSIEVLAINKLLVDEGELPYCNPMFYQEYEGESYLFFGNDLYSKEINEYYDEKRDNTPKRFIADDAAFKSYTGIGYGILNEYSLHGDISDMSLEEAKEDREPLFEKAKTTKDACQIAKTILNTIDTYIDMCPPIEDNLILSRRVQGDEISKIIDSLQIGDTFEMKPLQSFSLAQIRGFGDRQITLITKKGSKGVAPVGRKNDEMEYLTKTNTKVKVVSKGYNSMAIELI